MGIAIAATPDGTHDPRRHPLGNGLEREKRVAALRGRRAELRILYRSCPPAHRERVRGLIADIEEELRDLGDKTNSEAER